MTSYGRVVTRYCEQTGPYMSVCSRAVSLHADNRSHERERGFYKLIPAKIGRSRAPAVQAHTSLHVRAYAYFFSVQIPELKQRLHEQR